MPLREPSRRAIVSLLRDGDRTAGEICAALDRRRPGISHHLSHLLAHGLVEVRQEGRERTYSLNLPRALEAWNDLLRHHHGG